METKPMNNDERHFMISTKSLQLYSKLVFISDFSNYVCRKGGISIGPDAAVGLGNILDEIIHGLLQIREWNEEIARNNGINNTTGAVQE
jgi:hypothetical protein